MRIPLQPVFEHDDDELWSMLYTRLRPLVRGWVFDSHVSCWIGEEEAVADDIISETVERTFKRVNFSDAGQEPVFTVWGFARKTAYHYFIDLVRKQGREVPLSHLCDETNEPPPLPDPYDMEDAVHEAVDNEQLFQRAAQEIKDFPKKQRDALLIDQAKHTHFEGDPTPLQRAYQEVGIRLQDYCSQIPANESELRRHSSLLYHATRRLAHLPSMQPYTFFP